MRKYTSYELARMDPTDIAQHLCMYEHKMYAKIRGQECLRWSKVQTGNTVKNLAAFSQTHNKLTSWVKISILEMDGPIKRAQIVNFWIRVAEASLHLSYLQHLALSDWSTEVQDFAELPIHECYRLCIIKHRHLASALHLGPCRPRITS